MPRRSHRSKNKNVQPLAFDDPFAGLDWNTINPPPPPPPPLQNDDIIYSDTSSSSSDDEDSANVIAEEPGMTAQARHLFRDNGRRRWRTKITDSKNWRARSDMMSKFAIVVRREKNIFAESGLRLHSVTIQSPLLKQFLDEVFEGYAGVSTNLKDLTFNGPFQEFVHRWDRYENLVREATEETQLIHIELLNDVLEPEIKPLVLRKREMIEKNLASFQILWSLFEPKCEVYAKVDGQERVFQLQSCEYQQEDQSVCLGLHCKCIDFDGTSFGYAPYYLSLEQFDGCKPISELKAIPLALHPDRHGVEERLMARGKMFEQLKGFHYKSYTGRVVPSEHGRRPQSVINRRVVIDANMYHSRSDDSINPRPILEPLREVAYVKTRKQAAAFGAYTSKDLEQVSLSKAAGTSSQEKREIEEHQYRLCTSEVKGYDLKSKSWIKMQIDGIGDIDFNPATFKRLILPNDNKELILSLVESHLGQEDNKFDDIVEGKGQGMVVLLSGEPGIGKTLTAEAVAEQMKKPLFSMSAGQLGPTLENVEDDLDDILEICAKWGAVLLLDEADVFLEKRELTDIHRNKLVSVFLRLLEYYEGCLFLTTNRATSLDPAIRSRIDLHVDYGKLDFTAKRHIWRTFVKPSEDFPDNTSLITEEDLDVLAKLDINGREIKNLVKTGRLLAKKKDEELGMAHLKTVLSVQTGVPMM